MMGETHSLHSFGTTKHAKDAKGISGHAYMEHFRVKRVRGRLGRTQGMRIGLARINSRAEYRTACLRCVEVVGSAAGRPEACLSERPTQQEQPPLLSLSRGLRPANRIRDNPS